MGFIMYNRNSGGSNMKTIKVRNLVLGEGREKIISSIMDHTIEDTLKTMEIVKKSKLDCIEWRGDFCKDVHDIKKMQRNLEEIRNCLGDFPILFTFRSTYEGGNMDLEVDEYVNLNKGLIDTGLLDLVDVEILIGDEKSKELIDYAHSKGVKVICSYHNFKETPSIEYMINLMNHMRMLGADIPKCAVMAKDTSDLLKVLTATNELTKGENGPVLTMAMGKAGTLSRVTGEIFGSCLTFCSLKKASAPGQVSVDDGYQIMEMIHKYNR